MAKTTFFTHLFLITNHNKISIITAIIIGAIASNYILASFFDVTKAYLVSNCGIALFVVFTFILYGVGQFFLLRLARRAISQDLKIYTSVKKLEIFVWINQVVLSAIMLTIVISIMYSSQYNLGLFIVAAAIGSIPSIMLTALLGFSLLSWYRSNKQSIVVLLLGVSASIAAIAAVDNAVIITIIFLEKPDTIDPQTQIDFNQISSTKILNTLLYFTEEMAATIAALIQLTGIALLLRNFSRQIGQIKYWIIVCIPAAVVLMGLASTLLTSPS